MCAYQTLLTNSKHDTCQRAWRSPVIIIYIHNMRHKPITIKHRSTSKGTSPAECTPLPTQTWNCLSIARPQMMRAFRDWNVLRWRLSMMCGRCVCMTYFC